MNNSSNSNHRGKILIVDDEYANLRTLTDMLESEGYDVRGAIDRETAMMIIANDPPDLILLDIKLPVTSGYEVCKELKGNTETKEIPIAFLSALDDAEDKVQGFKAGAVDYISKPFNAVEVLVRVATHLQISRLNRLLSKELDQKKILFESLIENIPAGIYVKNENDEHIVLNKLSKSMVGKETEDLIGKTTYDIFDSAVADNLIAEDRQILANELTPIVKEWGLTTEEGTIFIRDYKFRIELPSGEKLVGGVAFDISEIKENEMQLKQALQKIEKLNDTLNMENKVLKSELEMYPHHIDIVGESEALQNCLRQAAHVAPENTTVLVLGETGTGKELLGQAIHDLSPRSNRTMVKVNCAALPANLIESELFGREKGAYTGSMSRQAGRFELADGSTIFLDEIGDLPLELQSKLLRVLQEGTFEMLGSVKPIKVDVRIIAATNHDLYQLVQDGKFRKDLYYRLNVFPITVPPLRDRQGDIALLAWAFIHEFNRSMGKSVDAISSEDLDYLSSYDWPGNIRELKNIIERSMILCSGHELKVQKARDAALMMSQDIKNGVTLADVEKRHILEILQNTGWRVSGEGGAAEVLGLKPTTLEARMKKHGIQRPS